MAKKTIDKSCRENFIKSVARDCIKGLSKKEINYIKTNPNPIEYHFTLGIDIRNKYIYEADLPFPVWDADYLSGDIVEEIIRIVTKGETVEQGENI